MKILRKDVNYIINETIQAVLPDKAVREAVKNIKLPDGKLYLVSIGKAGWQMAHAASLELGGKLTEGIVITKYGHCKGNIPQIKCYEAGHPVPDDNSFKATQKAIELVKQCNKEDMVLFCISGGGSALFEQPLVPGEELLDITNQLLACGADIIEINTIRKRLSAVKGGRFAKLCSPAKVYSIILSDVSGDCMDAIASGPAYPDTATSDDAITIAKKYGLSMSKAVWDLLEKETPKQLDNVESHIIGNVSMLCEAAKRECEKRGYRAQILTDCMSCEAKEAGAFLGAVAKTYSKSGKPLAFIAGGETVVHITGNGKGGRNQEIVLSAAQQIAGLENVAIFSIGSDGTDGPTDAAGGYCDGGTAQKLAALGYNIYDVLKNNDSYTALDKTGSLIKTGATGTNVNDVTVVFIN